ncbi:MAG: RsiV family protein [Spirochaetaceae bacterium]|nr:RsiV family protein [Spirochaetaceae bacterium]
MPEAYATYIKSETALLFPGRDRYGPRLQFAVYALDVSDEAESGLLNRVLYGGLPCREYAENLFSSVKDDYLKANKDAPPDSKSDWSYIELFDGGVYGQVTVISRSRYVYLGGAHGQNEKICFVLDTGALSQVLLDDILQDGAKAVLQEHVDDALGSKYGAGPGAPLRAAGFLEDSGGVPENFFLSPEGLGFCWNPYEIAPYSMGIIEITLPYGDIESLLNDRGLDLAGNF